MPGRRGARVEDAERWVFNRLAEAYRSRPGYPEALVSRLVELASASASAGASVTSGGSVVSPLGARASAREGAPARPGGRVVDLGAGTGDLAIPLALRGLRVAAVEPARKMLDVLERRAAEREIAVRSLHAGASAMNEMERRQPRDPGSTAAAALTGEARLLAVHAAAESTGLPAASFDLAVVADALHWLDPERAGAELARLLAPGGALAIIEVELLPSPFTDALWPRLQAANPKARPRALDLAGPRTQLFSLAAPGAERSTETFDLEDSLSPEAAAAVVASLSFAGPALSPAALESLTRWAADQARAGGAVWRRRLHLRWTRTPENNKGAAR